MPSARHAPALNPAPLAAVTAFNPHSPQSAVNDAASFRGGACVAVTVMARLVILRPGRLDAEPPAARADNDERTRHRGGALAALFVAMGTALALYALSYRMPVELRAGLRSSRGPRACCRWPVTPC